MKALIAGASGMIGRQLLTQLIHSQQYEQIYILVRKQLPETDPSVIQIIFDFESMSPPLPFAEHIFCCLGTTIAKAGSKDAFSKVDKEYPLKLAKATKENGAKVFCIVTAGGANPKSFFFYNRVKGEVEEQLKEFQFDHLGIFRPSMLLGTRKENRPLEHAGQVVMTALDFLIPNRYKAIQGKKVAKAMKKFAILPDQKIRIFESDEMNVHE